MSAPNTPTPGSPEWLRQMADSLADEASMPEGTTQALREAAGIRLAAERIEQLMRKIAQQEDWWQEMQRLRAENDALRQDKERLDWLDERGVGTRRCGESEDWIYETWSVMTFDENNVNVRAAIDAARKEGA